MKKIISLILCAAILLTGCAPADNTEIQNTAVVQTVDEQIETDETELVSEPFVWNDVDIQYNSLDDANLLAHIEDLVYCETVHKLNSEQYFVENVSAVYISKEYLEEIAYNSQANIYFGYTLAELNDLFEGSKYVFALDEDGTTTAQVLTEIPDTSTEEILTNVAIGTGVILLCVTVSVVTGGVGAPAISMIFAASAKTGAIMALSSAAIGGVSAGVVRGIETGDMNEALEAAALAGNDGFKWGAIVGAVSGGASQAIALKGATCGGLTMNQAALIQKESNLPLDFIKNFHSVEEYNVYKQAGLVAKKVNGKWAFLQRIDWKYKDEFVRTNAERVKKYGLAPIDSATGKSFELHHIGQKADSPLAILNEEQHHGKGVFSILHKNTGQTGKAGVHNDVSGLTDAQWAKQKKEFWENLLAMTGE